MNETKLEPVKVMLSGRSTGMGAHTQKTLYSLRQKRILEPKRTESSKTGNHWDDIFFLLPGKYLVAERDISNTGKHSCGYSCLKVLTYGEYFEQEEIKPYFLNNPVEKYKELYKEGNGSWKTESWGGNIPEFVEPPCECLEKNGGEE